MKKSSAPVPFLTGAEYFQLIEETAIHLAHLRGFNNCTMAEDWQLAELRVLNVISDVDVQYTGNTRMRR